ncbi:Uncharacterised protein [Citrobacter koseri]|uniref:Uncharacterized protein n=1 Tax=Citrobacter koseri TaxID=545 RepID=A0A2X2VVJ7_CITKO|nr:Uncharacterised protein [Citrobacter koseri]
MVIRLWLWRERGTKRIWPLLYLNMRLRHYHCSKSLKASPVGPAGEKQVAFFRRVYADIPDFSAELKKENVVNVFIATGYPLAFFSTTALSNPEGLKGGNVALRQFLAPGVSEKCRR